MRVSLPAVRPSLRHLALAACLPVLLTACEAVQAVVPESLRPVAEAPAPPPMRWDHRPEAEVWTATAFSAMEGHGAALPAITPRDIDTWCPGYAEGTEDERKAFWAGLISALAKHESTWNPRAVGGGGRWYGLVQIAPATARGYGCEARSGEALKNGEANLSCAIRIMARTVSRDQVVSAGMRGVAADWGPFHSGRKREDMRAWVSTQPYCAG
ncbi:MAG: transglycosylase SLT domain-containing protein [Pseudomonadota bacterium]